MAVTAQKYDAEGALTGTVDLPESLFGCDPHVAALHAYTKVYLTNRRQGTAKTKTRAEVSGGGTKPWRQKGTGRARAGSNTSPVWVGGGRAFGPRVRHHHEALPRKVRRLALISALSLKAREGAVRVWDRRELDGPRTKAVVSALEKMGVVGCQTLFLDEGLFPNLVKSCRNVSWLTHRRADIANAYQVMRAHALVVTPEGLERMAEVFGA
ncbi:MAG TPA: 50S ribosomal protein L4 [Acidobacteriota bacterium]|nr:50S ribosomal protein L4 [Acidobacteriota bacterium]